MLSTALLVIDVQSGMFDETPPIYQGAELLAKIASLIDRARQVQAPVIYIQHCGDGNLAPQHPGWAVHPSIAPTPDEICIHKHHPDSFQDTGLQASLQQLGVKNLVIAGIQTEYCVDTTCRRAYSLGYPVTLVQDAHSTWDTEALSAAQIIAHHNLTLGGWFAELKQAGEILFNA